LLSPEELEEIVQAALGDFYKRRLALFDKLNLKKIFQRKNPYLFRAIGINEPQKLIDAVLAAYLSSSDEGIFGNTFFEPVAINVSGGRKSITDSVDFELEVDGVIRAYAVKSGLSVFNNQSLRRQIQAFDECRRRLPGKSFEAVVGYAYGCRSAPPTEKRNFRAVAGQAFWEEISGDPDLYKKIFALLAKKADEHSAEYKNAYTELVNKLIAEFEAEFSTASNQIDWDKLLALNSGKKNPKTPKAKKPRMPRKAKASEVIPDST
jgi:hypothetical protein